MAGRPKKDPFADLDDAFKAAVQESDDATIRTKITDAALFRVQVEEARKADVDLQMKKDVFHEADAPYKDDVKAANMKIQYCREVLKSRGKNV